MNDARRSSSQRVSGFLSIAAVAVTLNAGAASRGQEIVAWGLNDTGQTSVPAPNTGFVAVAAGYYHALGLKDDGSIVGWGWNDFGQSDSPAPNSDFVAVAGGWGHSLGLKAGGSIVAWGKNDFGQIDVPPPNAGFVAIAAGPLHSLGVKADGSIIAWGDNSHGQSTAPVPNTGFVAVAGSWHNLGLKSDGSIVAWGLNNLGQTAVPAPNSGFVGVAAGGGHSLGLKADGSIVGWGNNTHGQIGVPAPNSGFAAVAAGWFHSLALTQAAPTPISDPSGLNKPRFISFSLPAVSTAGGSESALRVRLVSLHHVAPPYSGGPTIPFTSFEGQVRWVGPPVQYVESSSSGIPFMASQLQCAPHYQDWSTVGLLHVTGSAVVPSSIYEVENLAASCMGSEPTCTAVSAPLSINTTRWGDVENPYNPPSTTVQADITDVSALVNKFRNTPGAPIKARALMAGAPGSPFGEITPVVMSVDFGFSHISACVDAFRGAPYPYTIAACP